ncbi:MAG: energy-coupling factor transporter transmembrane component T [Tissierellia bacterium]|nr:energy-coupling factor transporter transmembrane component T [Tissierellia bacterium]
MGKKVMQKEKFNPNPISKLIALCIISFSLITTKSEWVLVAIVGIYAIMYAAMGYAKKSLKLIVFYGALLAFIHYASFPNMPWFINMMISLLVIVKIFFTPFMAGEFLISTSDVGSMVASMDKLRLPKAFSIPIATMFRFFPSYGEEFKNIRFAMKMRGITLRKPLLALEYIYVPLLSISSEIAEDISKYVETKAMANPGEKTRFTEIKFGMVDLLFLGTLIATLVVDKL